MAVLNNPRVNHLVHLILLGTFMFFSFLTLAISAAFIAKGKSLFNGYYYDAAGLILAESIFSYIAAFAFLVFNTIGSIYKGVHNSILIELVVFAVLFVFSLAGAAALSSDGEDFDCSSKACDLGKATLAFAWLSTITLILLLVFLATWTLIHRQRNRGDGSIFKTSIKAHHVDGPFQSGGGRHTNMANLAPSATVAADRPLTPARTTVPA